eukprot:TRINITY_DN27725_c0_g1_i1.p1 TRINITY_DN27725_c0_g1~~TRINITY_DN27725_c0_g1_i1.p1  ORF type:complete len:131 (+),score=8.58 TRINITY_DN27725_c0_g1_i1:101-493(+)
MSDWEKSICGCFGDAEICILTCFCPCVQLGKNMEGIGESFALWMLLPILFYITTAFSGGFLPLSICIPFICCVARGNIRNKFGIEGNCCLDCICVCCCDLVISWLLPVWWCRIWLTICQGGNEVKYRTSG